MAAEDNMMTLEEFLAKARAGPLEKEVDSLQRACLEECLRLESHLATNPFEGSIVVFVNEVEVEDGRGKRVWS